MPRYLQNAHYSDSQYNVHILSQYHHMPKIIALVIFLTKNIFCPNHLIMQFFGFFQFFGVCLKNFKMTCNYFNRVLILYCIDSCFILFIKMCTKCEKTGQYIVSEPKVKSLHCLFSLKTSRNCSTIKENRRKISKCLQNLKPEKLGHFCLVQFKNHRWLIFCLLTNDKIIFMIN